MLRRLTADQQRSVRHWAMEFVVVVAGVLIALWLQQWTERRRAQSEMRAAEQAIHDEVRGALTALVWREAISQCHRDRIELLQSRLTKMAVNWTGVSEDALFIDSGNLPGTIAHSVYQRPLDTFSDAAWTSALSTGALAPMDRERFGRLVGIYDAIRFLQQTRELEDRASSTLSPLGNDIELTPELRAEMFRAIYDVDRSRFTFSLIGADALASEMQKLGWNDKSEIDRWIADNRRGIADSGMKGRSCIAPERNPFKAAEKR